MLIGEISEFDEPLEDIEEHNVEQKIAVKIINYLSVS